MFVFFCNIGNSIVSLKLKILTIQNYTGFLKVNWGSLVHWGNVCLIKKRMKMTKFLHVSTASLQSAVPPHRHCSILFDHDEKVGVHIKKSPRAEAQSSSGAIG